MLFIVQRTKIRRDAPPVGLDPVLPRGSLRVESRLSKICAPRFDDGESQAPAALLHRL